MSTVSNGLRREFKLSKDEEAYKIGLGGVCFGGKLCLWRRLVITRDQVIYQEDPFCGTKTTKSIAINKITDVSHVQPCCWCIDDLTLDTGSGQEFYLVCSIVHIFRLYMVCF